MPLNIDQNSSVSIYQQLVEQLRAKILTQEWGPGTRLPSELDIARDNQISRGTVRQAMMVLVNEGLVERIQGKGTYVTDTALNTDNTLIGVILPYERDALGMDILVGAQQAAHKNGYHVIFSQTKENLTVEARDVENMRQKGVAGLVIFPPGDVTHDETIAKLDAEGFPFVLVDRYFPEMHTNYVVVDNFSGGYQATRHLIKRGHEHIGFLTPNRLETSSVHERFKGYRQALTEFNIPYEPELFLRYKGLMQPDTELASLRQYLTAENRPSAIFAVTDLLAIRVLQAAQLEGIAIPDDLALVGFDDIGQASQVSVPLTTIAQPRVEIGERASQILLEQIQGKRPNPVQIVLPTRLVIRQSSG